MSEAPAVVAVKGPDSTLRARAIDDAVGRLLGDDDRSLALSEAHLPPQRGRDGDQGGAEARMAALAAALDGARTPPFGTQRRIVVVRVEDGWLADEGERVAAYLADPEPTTVLVLEAPGRLPAALGKALTAAHVEEVATAGGRSPAKAVLLEEAARAGIKLDERAVEAVSSRVGDAVGRIPSIVAILVAAHGEDAGGRRGGRLTEADVLPYVSDTGGVPVFELTKAVDAGDQVEALRVLGRMLGPMGMHPLQVLALLHNHFKRILRLDDPTVRNERDAVEALGGKVKAYPAKLAWQRAQRLGTDGIRRAFDLLARADTDLRGGSLAPPEAVVEVLVTRLTLLSKQAARTRS